MADLVSNFNSESGSSTNTLLDGTTQSMTNTIFVKILVAIICGWVLIQLWVMFIKAFAYNYLGLNKDSALHTLYVALVGTGAFIIYTNLMGKEKETIHCKMTGMSVAPYTVAQSIIA